MKKFRIIAKYYVGYGANLRRLRGVRNEYYIVYAESVNDAEKKLEEFNGRKERGLSAGWILEITNNFRVFNPNSIIIN